MISYSFFISINCQEHNDTLIYIQTEVPPTFTYETCTTTGESVKTYIRTNFIMPPELSDNGYTGCIYLGFIIEKDSTLSNFKIVRGISTALDNVVLETVKNMPKWGPGLNKGKPVRTQFTLPIPMTLLYEAMVIKK